MKNQLNPTGDSIRAFRDRATGKPIFMLNLLKFRDKAAYADGRDPEMTGREVYARYAEGMEKLVIAAGGSITFSGTPRGVLIGDAGGDDLWDAVAIVQYPDTQTMLEILRLPEYQALHVHREAGLAGQLLIECAAGTGLGR